MESVLALLAVFALVFINGFFVASEFALVGARRTRIAQLAAEGSAGARAADAAIGKLDNFIAATQLGITLASLGLGWIGEPAVAHLLEPAFKWIVPGEVAGGTLRSVSIAVGFSIVTMLHIVLGELAPKAIALQRPERTAVIIALPVTWFMRLFRPVIFLMNSIGNGVVRLLGFEPAGGHQSVHSAEELVMLVESAHEAGVLEDAEERLLQRAFDFSEIHLRDVMQPRMEVEALPVTIALRELVQRVSRARHSRFPVYEGSIDRVIGIVHAKDLLELVVNQPALLTTPDAAFDLRGVLREPLFFPEMASVDKVLEQMQRVQAQFTIVVDEFGGMAGIATMEDILEELIGEVQDEFDAETAPVSIAQDVLVLDGLVTLHDVIERLGPPDIVEPQSATIGGYVAEMLDRIPAHGDKVRYGPYDVVVEEMDEMRVARVRFARRVTPGEDLPAQPTSLLGNQASG